MSDNGNLNIAVFCIGKLGGSTEVAANLALSLRARGHSCDFYAYGESQRNRLLREGIEVFTPQSLDYPLFSGIPTDFGFLLAFDRRHRKQPYDVVHTHYAVPLVHVMSNLHRIYGVPCVLTFHGSDVTIAPDLFDVRIVARLVESARATITVASQFLARETARMLDLDGERIHIIPNTIAPEYFEDTAPAGASRPYFLHCSNLRQVKRVSDIVLAMCALRKRAQGSPDQPLPNLKIVGEGPDLPDLKLMACKCALTEQVQFVGRIDDKRELRDIMAGATALILSSVTESQPLTALEAMTVGTPLVCARFTAAPELVGEHGERGWLYDIGDRLQLADTLMHIMTHPDEAKAAAERAKEYARVNHHVDRVVGEYLDLYRDIIDQKERMP